MSVSSLVFGQALARRPASVCSPAGRQLMRIKDTGPARYGLGSRLV